MRQREHGRRAGLRAGLAAVLAVLAFAAIAAAYVHEPGPAATPGSVELPALPSAVAASYAMPPATRATPSKEVAAGFRFGSATSSWFAPVTRPVAARATPSASARVVARLATTTPERTTNVVPLVQRVLRAGTLWVEVGLPVLPNGTTGWVPRTSLGGYQFLTTRLVVSLASEQATLFRGGKKIFSASVGVGQSRWPTPTGEFIIRNKLTRYASPTYGPVAFGTSARSAVLTDWPAGGFTGIHGTNQPGLIPGRISHGCIRMRNADILRLAKLMPLGTPLTIR